MQLNIYYSYACRDSYLVYAWLKQVQQRGELLHLNWQPFAIQMDDPNTYWKLPWKFASSELRGFIAAEAAKQQGNNFFDRFHDALEGAVHEQILELGDETTLLGAAKQAGLNLEKFQADWRDRRLAEAAMSYHEQGVAKFNVSGTPTIIFPNGRSFQLELSKIPAGHDVLGFLHGVELLAVSYPYVGLLKKTYPAVG